jgi:hypothetical protein
MEWRGWEENANSESATMFILVLPCKCTSIVHRFRCDEHVLLAGNDVITIQSPGDASGNFCLRILKGRPRFHISITL